MKTILAACCAALLCALSLAQAPTKTALPTPDASLKDHVPSFSTKRRAAKPFQPPSTNSSPRTVTLPPAIPGSAPAPRGLAPTTQPVPVTPITPPATPATPTPATPPAAPAPVPAPTTSPEPAAPPAPADPATPPAARTPSTPTPTTTPTPTPTPTPAPGVARRATPTGKAAEYHLQYKEFFTENDFTDELVGYWQQAFVTEPERSAEIVQESAAFAAEAVAAGLREEPFAHASVANGLAWLELLFQQADETAWKQVGDAISAAFSEAPAPLAEALEGRRDADTVRTAMQTCLTLALFGDATQMGRWCAFSDRSRAFISDGQAFLFGGEALSNDQYASLVSLFAAVPREVHQVLAVIVPEGARMDVAGAGLRTPGVLLNIYAGTTGISEPDEFFSELGTQPVAPLFALEAAAQLVRAAQFVQFSQRPELQQRRDLILRNAGLEPTRYLRRSVPPAAYLAEPDELLPQTAYLWFIDSATAFAQAGGLLRFNENEAMDALLLLADTLSGGGDQALEFRTDFSGHISSRPVPLERTEVLPGVAFASGIVVGGQAWHFGFQRNGGVTRETAPVAIVDNVGQEETPTP